MPVEVGVRAPEYRLPDAARVGRVRLQVSDLPRSLDYYQRTIGLRPLDRAADRVVLGAQDGDAPVVELFERRGVQPVPRHGRLGLYHFALLVPDRATLGRFVSHLADFDVAVAAADHLVSEALYLWDPDGLGIEVYADRPRETWRAAGREVAMTTEPLDLRDLRRAGSGHPWTGMPRGTTVGHVHLHVGSLDRADALYHRALGFDRMVWSYPGALFLAAGGYHHHLGTNTWARGAPPAGDNDARLLEWELLLPSADDVAAAGASLEKSGYRPVADEGSYIVIDDWGTPVRLASVA